MAQNLQNVRITITRPILFKILGYTGAAAAGIIALNVILKLIRRRKRQQKVWRSIRSDSIKSQKKNLPNVRLKRSGASRKFYLDVEPSFTETSTSTLVGNGSIAGAQGDYLPCSPQVMHAENADRNSSVLAQEASHYRDDDEALALCNRGLEYLEEALHFWEDALTCVSQPPDNRSIFAVTTKEESVFVHKLESVLEHTINLHDECEQLVCLHRKPLILPWKSGGDTSSVPAVHKSQSDAYMSLHSSDSEASFESALEEVDDVSDSRVGVEEGLSVVDSQDLPLYHCGVVEATYVGVPCRSLRTKLVGCRSDRDFLSKLHALRLAMELTFQDEENVAWFVNLGKELLTELLIQAEKEPKEFLDAFQELIIYAQTEENWPLIEEELRNRGVVYFSFYDIVLDFIVMDAFDDLENPPSAVTHILHNRWLSNGFKETSLNTAIWGVFVSKRHKLLHPDGFISHFYSVSEHLSGVMAWGFLGPDTVTKQLCLAFKNETISFLRDLFDVDVLGYRSLEETSRNIMSLARRRGAQLLDAMTEIATRYEEVPIDQNSLM